MTHQANMFAASNQDLPLFSGTPQQGKREDFSPPQASRQLDLLPRPQPWTDEPEPPTEPEPTDCPTCFVCGELATVDLDTDRPYCQDCDAHRPTLEEAIANDRQYDSSVIEDMSW